VSEKDSPEPGPSAPTISKDGDDELGPVPPKRKADDVGEEDESEDEPEYEDEPDRTPITHEIVLKDHSKVSYSFEQD